MSLGQAPLPELHQGKKTRPLVADRLIAGLAAALIAGGAAAETPAPRDRPLC